MHQYVQQQGDCSKIALHCTVALRSSVMWSLQAPLQHAPCVACLRATASPCQVPVPGTIPKQNEELQNKYHCKTNSRNRLVRLHVAVAVSTIWEGQPAWQWRAHGSPGRLITRPLQKHRVSDQLNRNSWDCRVTPAAPAAAGARSARMQRSSAPPRDIGWAHRSAFMTFKDTELNYVKVIQNE